MEGTYSGHLVDKFRADQQLQHIIKGIVQMPHKYWQAWGIHNLPRTPVWLSSW